ncbi:DUF6328 family protein [Cognatilysobacter terrigena]|uniref:DUF6328 family protein n=1 Tax=Cognatilysobacter terrigena TaxID=2488749 RepID=UPI00105BCC7B|nr:DUF6328 family protein [Lysobacter terrigena]
MHEGSAGAEALSLTKAADHLIEECRMVLPGVQALFGFQLVAVFSDRFQTALTQSEKELHLVSIALVVVAIALIMTPAAYHRLTAPGLVTAHFLRLSTRLLMAGMPMLMAALVIDAYLVGRLIDGARAGFAIAAALLVVFVALWFVLPIVSRLLRIDPSSPP